MSQADDVCAAEAARLAANARVEARENHEAHAELRLRFALALASTFPDLALAAARAHNFRGDDFSPVLQVFDLAEAMAAEHERRCAEEKGELP